VERAAAMHRDPAYRADDAAEITLRKNFLATGSFLNRDRGVALDLLGFASQLVFDTFTSPHALRFDRGDELLPPVSASRLEHSIARATVVSVGARKRTLHPRRRMFLSKFPRD
jgi:hypothetical protein